MKWVEISVEICLIATSCPDKAYSGEWAQRMAEIHGNERDDSSYQRLPLTQIPYIRNLTPTAGG